MSSAAYPAVLIASTTALIVHDVSTSTVRESRFALTLAEVSRAVISLVIAAVQWPQLMSGT